MAGGVEQVEAVVAEIVDDELACAEANLVHFPVSECGRENRSFGVHWPADGEG